MNDNYLCPLRVVRVETTRTPPDSFYNWSRDCPNPDKYQTNIYVAYYRIIKSRMKVIIWTVENIPNLKDKCNLWRFPKVKFDFKMFIV